MCYSQGTGSLPGWLPEKETGSLGQTALRKAGRGAVEYGGGQERQGDTGLLEVRGLWEQRPLEEGLQGNVEWREAIYRGKFTYILG
jgi:hypothetical protein